MSAIADEFDGLAGVYEHNRLSAWYKAQAKHVLCALDRTQVGVLLDIGCGTGWLLRQAVTKHSKLLGIGVDLSAGMISVARKSASAAVADGNLIFHHDDWESLDPKELIDDRIRSPQTITCVSSFHYFVHPEGAIKKIYDCLADDGQLLLMDRVKDGSWLTRVWDYLHRTWIRDQVRFFDTRELVTLLEGAGFEDIQILRRIKRLFWKRKHYTSLVLLRARKQRAKNDG